MDWLRVGVGLIMLVLGLVGLVFPILQGILFLIVAALLLAPYSRRIQRIQLWSERRFPAVHRQAHQIAARVARRCKH